MRRNAGGRANELMKVRLGGEEQWVLIRGESLENPPLLFLHGGPGFAQISFAPAFQRDLERRFVVVNWDQRGAGKSYRWGASVSELTLETYVADTAELVRWLLARFRQSGVFLVGHSWGATLGFHVVRHCPKGIHAFVATGVGAQFQEGERLSIDYLIAQAQKHGNSVALERLRSIEFPITHEAFIPYVEEKARWMKVFGGQFCAGTGALIRRALPTMLLSRRYGPLDYVRFVRGIRLGQEFARRIVPSVDLFEEVPQIDVPVCFCIGRYDYNTAFEMSQRYFEALRAPAKRWIWFEGSGHAPPFEEPMRFAEAVASLLPEAVWSVETEGGSWRSTGLGKGGAR